MREHTFESARAAADFKQELRVRGIGFVYWHNGRHFVVAIIVEKGKA